MHLLRPTLLAAAFFSHPSARTATHSAHAAAMMPRSETWRKKTLNPPCGQAALALPQVFKIMIDLNTHFTYPTPLHSP